MAAKKVRRASARKSTGRRRSAGRKTSTKRKPSQKHKHREIVVTKWAEFVELATGNDFKNWAFRGHMSSDWNLNSTLARHLINHEVHESVWAHQEERILRIFRRKAHHFVDHLPAAEDSFRWLALMQHHGSPTRLLDLTWSPYVAAFFALERATGDAAVWALNAAAIECATDDLRESAGLPPDFRARAPGHIERHLLPRPADLVFIGEPQEMNRRLIAQSGTFALQGTLAKTVDEILATYPDWREYAVKLVLKTGSVRRDALRELYNMNLTPATLFPDLDGLARSLAYELEFHWAFDPHTGREHPGYVWERDADGRPLFPRYD